MLEVDLPSRVYTKGNGRKRIRRVRFSFACIMRLGLFHEKKRKSIKRLLNNRPVSATVYYRDWNVQKRLNRNGAVDRDKFFGWIKLSRKGKTTQYAGQNTRDRRKRRKKNRTGIFIPPGKKNHKRWIRSGLTINVKKWPSDPVAG